MSGITNITAFFVICLPIIVHSCTLEFFKGTEICGGVEDIWTVGHGSRSLIAVVENKNCGNRNLLEDVVWCAGDPCRTYDVRTYASARWILVNETHLVSELTFYDVIKAPGPNQLYTMRQVSQISPSQSHLWNISNKYCPKWNEKGVEVLNMSDRNVFGNSGRFSCPEGHFLVDFVNGRLVTNTSTVCGTCARWEKMEQMDCWRVPNVTINPRFLNVIHTVSDQLTAELCTVLDYGYPGASVALYHSHTLLSTPLILQPYHNNMTLYCKAENQLTKLLNSSGEFSEPYTVIVEFGPAGYSDWTSCTLSNAESKLYDVRLLVSLSANPPVEAPIISDGDQKQNVSIKSYNRSVGCCGVPVQIYKINFVNVTKRSKVTVEFHHKLQKLTLVYNDITGNCSHLQTSTLPTATTSSKTANMSDAAIAVICIGVVIILILVTGFLTLNFRKRTVLGSLGSDQGGSARQNQPALTVLTVKSTVEDSSQLDKLGGSSYEIPIAHAYQNIKEKKIEPAYQKVEDASKPGFGEDTAYAL